MNRLIRRCVIVGGTGEVGLMFAEFLLGLDVEVCLIDRNHSNSSFKCLVCDIMVPTAEVETALQQADLVILALPEQVAIHAVSIVSKRMKSQSLLTHTLSVQAPISEQIYALDLPFEVVGLNPMFAPRLGMESRPIAAIIRNNGPRVAELLGNLSKRGARVVQLDAEEHDQLVAAMQALTHASILAFGLALVNLNIDITKLTSLAPPPHATMLALLARISSGTPEVYWDVQTANKQAAIARKALSAAIKRLDKVTADISAFNEFTNLLSEVRGVMSNELTPYQELCAFIFNESRPFLYRDLQDSMQ